MYGHWEPPQISSLCRPFAVSGFSSMLAPAEENTCGAAPPIAACFQLVRCVRRVRTSYLGQIANVLSWQSLPCSSEYTSLTRDLSQFNRDLPSERLCCAWEETYGGCCFIAVAEPTRGLRRRDAFARPNVERDGLLRVEVMPSSGADEAPDASLPSLVVSGALFANVWTAHGVRWPHDSIAFGPFFEREVLRDL